MEEEFPLPEEEFEPEPEPEFELEFAEEQPAEEQGWEEPEVERQVLISSNRKDVVIEGEIIDLYSELIGFDGVQVYYQWQVDRGDGAGWVDVEGATEPNHSFVARKDTILYSWRLTITTDE